MKKLYLLPFLIIILLSNCKKETIPELESRSVVSDFFISGDFGGEKIDLKASGDYYMFSDFYFDTSKTVNVFVGEIKNRNLASDHPKVRLEIIDFITYNMGIDSLLGLTTIEMYDSASPGDYLGKATLILDLNDGTGEKRSSSISQPLSRISIKSLKQYSNNEKSQNTFRVEFDGEILLPTSSGQALFKFNAAFALAYPV